MVRRRLGTIIVLVILLGFLAWALWTMVVLWTSTDVKMSGHGWAALILGVFFTCLVGFGLTGLMFFSNRRGYDEPPTFDRRDDAGC
jgi:hypothetical protein